MDEEAMEKQYNEVAARAVLGYLYDHDMYMLAEQFCIDCPYLGTGSSSFEWTRLPATVLQKPLQQVMKEFIAMQSQLLQLVNLCSTVVPFPPTESAVVLVDHLINLLKSSNMLGVFNEVIGNQPDYNPIQDIQPQPIPPTPPEIVVGGSAASLDIPIEPVGSTAVPASSISPVHGMAVNTPHMGPIEPNPPPTAVQEQQPLAINQTEGVTLCVPPPSTDNQSKPTAILATVTNNTVVLSPQQINQLKKPVSVEGKPAASPTSGAHEHPVPQPTEKGQSALTGTDATQSNATPLDNPIVSGTTSSRSTSSRKRTHIRILDFGTPPIKRGSPSTSYCSSTGRQSPSAVPPSPPARAIPVLKLPASTDASLEEPEKEQQAVATESDVQSKPKKRTPGRPLELGDVNSNNQWPVGSTPVTKQSAETVRRGPSVESKSRLSMPVAVRQTEEPAIMPGRISSANKVNPSADKPTTPPPSMSKHVSPPRTQIPGSPGFAVDPLAVYPMTPRFLTRPLQPLCMLSPLLGTLDTSGISMIKSLSHTKPSDINTPGYPITPGCSKTPSPPPDSVSYYEGKPPPPGSSCGPADGQDEAYDSDRSEVRSNLSAGRDREANEGDVSREPQLTLTASTREITIQYREGHSQLPSLRERDSEYDERLASRIEIDNGSHVFEIAIAPLINLFENDPV